MKNKIKKVQKIYRKFKKDGLILDYSLCYLINKIIPEKHEFDDCDEYTTTYRKVKIPYINYYRNLSKNGRNIQALFGLRFEKSEENNILGVYLNYSDPEVYVSEDIKEEWKKIFSRFVEETREYIIRKEDEIAKLKYKRHDKYYKIIFENKENKKLFEKHLLKLHELCIKFANEVKELYHKDI